MLHDAGFHSCWLHATHFDSVKIMKGSDGGDDPNKRLSMLNLGNQNGTLKLGPFIPCATIIPMKVI